MELIYKLPPYHKFFLPLFIYFSNALVSKSLSLLPRCRRGGYFTYPPVFGATSLHQLTSLKSVSKAPGSFPFMRVPVPDFASWP